MTERNTDTAATWHFHNATKYVLPPGDHIADDRIMMGEPPHLIRAIGEQSPANEPLPYKIYTSLDPIPLPRDPAVRTLTALDAIAATGDLAVEQAVPDLATLAQILLQSNGLLKRWTAPSGRVIDFRAAGCTGARYHLELYLVCGDLPDLAAGVYHYAAHDHTLRQLRAGDFRGALAAATGNEPSVARAPVTILCTSTFWRNAWRYQARAYRHTYWDAGTLLSHVLAVAADAGLSSNVVLGYADAPVNALLDVDGEHEATVALIPLGRTRESAPASPAVSPLNLPTQPISSSEIVFPEIVAMHAASNLASSAEAAEWRANPLQRSLPAPTGSLTRLRPFDPSQIPAESIEAVIQRRRSNRNYAVETPLPFDAFSTVLDRAMRGTAMDCLDPAAAPLHDVYLIVNNVEGLEPGSYVLNRAQGSVELLNPGNHRTAAARLALDQEYAADAHVNVHTLTDLDAVLARYGNRGYRLAQLEAAVFAGRLQLAAHALGLGAVGSTSPDDEVTAYFSPHAAAKSFMFIAVFGVRRPRGA